MNDLEMIIIIIIHLIFTAPFSYPSNFSGVAAHNPTEELHRYVPHNLYSRSATGQHRSGRHAMDPQSKHGHIMAQSTELSQHHSE